MRSARLWNTSFTAAREFVGQCHELVVRHPSPNLVQIRHSSHHAVDGGMSVVDALGGKLLHVLVYLSRQSTIFIHEWF